ncbi:MAG: hypothetical protein JF615_15475, partial [Asticcacaulis sp.]|nr:hypothetical protein [Asticcacaulis sp.]
WTGACAPDQTPGDVLNDGVRVNLFDMDGSRPKSAASASGTPANGGDEVD